MDHNCQGDANNFPTPEEDIEIFKAALSQGDKKHAIYHLACALSTNPNNTEWLKYLDDLIISDSELLQYIPVEDDNYFAVMAVRAYVCGKIKKFNEALNLIGQVLKIKPEIPYLIWVVEWESNIENIVEIQPKVIISNMGSFIKAVDIISEDQSDKVLSFFISLLKKMHEVNRKDYIILWCLSTVQKRIGDYEAALASAKNAYKMNKSWHTCTGIALVYRAKGAIRRAEWYYKKSLKYEIDITTYLDLGDMFFDKGLYRKAIKSYKNALEVEKNNEWATPSLLYCEHVCKKDKPSLKKLEDYFKANPSNMRAGYLLSKLKLNPGLPFIDYIPEPGEATINNLKQIAAENLNLDSGGSVKLTLSHLEAPSAINAYKLYLNGFGKSKNPVELFLEVSNIPEPDPRKPLNKDSINLWDYDGVIAKPSLPKPVYKFMDPVINLALTPYNLNKWYNHAEEIAKSMTPNLIPDLYAIMVYPPEPPQGYSSWNWIRKIQYAAVFILAHINKKDVPSSTLVSICYGQIDWPIEAAITMLAHQAILNPKIQIDVTNIFWNVVERINKEGYCFFSYSLVCNWLRFDLIDEELRNELKVWKSQIENE